MMINCEKRLKQVKERKQAFQEENTARINVCKQDTAEAITAGGILYQDSRMRRSQQQRLVRYVEGTMEVLANSGVRSLDFVLRMWWPVVTNSLQPP